jgi:hypothetical protein
MDEVNLESFDLKAIPRIDSGFFSGMRCCLTNSTLLIRKCVMKIHSIVVEFQSYVYISVYKSGFC